MKHKVDQQHSEAKSDYDSLKRDLDESVKALNNRRIEFSTKLAENDSMMQNIKHEAVVAQRDFENKIANLRQQLKEKDISHMAMNEAFENDMFELNKRLEKKDIEISELQKTYKTTHSHHTNLKLRVISQLDKARNQIENCEATKQKALLQCQEYDRQNKQIEEQCINYQLAYRRTLVSVPHVNQQLQLLWLLHLKLS